MRSRRERGRRAEDLACRYLEAIGWVILERNVYIGGGELDVVADDGTEIVFVEVRSRRGGRFAASVGSDKRAHLIQAAQEWWERSALEREFARFDLVVVETDGRGDRIRHLRSAFASEPTGRP